MSLLKKIGGVFWESDTSPKPKEKTPVKESETPVMNVTAINVAQPVVVSSNHVQIHEFVKHFSKIMEDENKRNFPGNDYYEFQVMKNAMSSIPQENLRYQAAFAGWAVGGNLTKEELVKTASNYLSIVEREISQFEEAYKHQYEQTILKNEQLISSKLKEVQELAERINTLNTEVNNLKKENIDNEADLTSKRDAFIAAGTQVKNEITAEISKINQFIQ